MYELWVYELIKFNLNTKYNIIIFFLMKLAFKGLNCAMLQRIYHQGLIYGILTDSDFPLYSISTKYYADWLFAGMWHALNCWETDISWNAYTVPCYKSSSYFRLFMSDLAVERNEVLIHFSSEYVLSSGFAVFIKFVIFGDQWEIKWHHLAHIDLHTVWSVIESWHVLILKETKCRAKTWLFKYSVVVIL